MRERTRSWFVSSPARPARAQAPHSARPILAMATVMPCLLMTSLTKTGARSDLGRSLSGRPLFNALSSSGRVGCDRTRERAREPSIRLLVARSRRDTFQKHSAMPIERLTYPFTAIVGQDRMKLALLLNAINPAIGGVLIRGDRGTAKSTAVRALAGLLPEQTVVEGCQFGCDPDDLEALCNECRARLSRDGGPLPR